MNIKLILNYFLFIITLSQFGYKEDCSYLSDGYYKLKYNSIKSSQKIELKVLGDSVFLLKNSDKPLKGKRECFNNSILLKFIYPSSHDANKISNQIIESFGKPCFELKRGNKDTILFRGTYEANLHITIAGEEGILQRLNKSL